MRSIITSLFFILVLMLFFSCGAKKKALLVSPSLENPNTAPTVDITEPKAQMSLDEGVLKDLITQQLSNYDQWKSTVRTMHIQAKGSATIPKNFFVQNTSVQINIHIAKDSVIWLSAFSSLLGREVFRGIFELDKVTLMSSFLQPNKMEMDYSELQRMLGVSLGFGELQDLFLFSMGTKYAIKETTNATLIDANLLYEGDSSPIVKSMNVQLPYQKTNIFPSQYTMEYKLMTDTKNYRLAVQGEMKNGDADFPEWQMNTQLFNNDARMFILNQKISSVEINMPFQNPSFD